MSKPEDISVILGRIRERAERIAMRDSFTDRDAYNHSDAERILALIEQAQQSILRSQLEQSVSCIKK